MTLESFCFAAIVVGAPFVVDQILLDEGVDLLMKAIDKSMSKEKALLWMGEDRAQFERQCKGIGHISLTRMFHLPPRFWGYYGLFLVSHYGIPKEIRKAARVTIAVVGLRKMAKVSRDIAC